MQLRGFWLMNMKERAERFPGDGSEAGQAHYRAYIDAPDNYDLMAAMQFTLMTGLGLRQYHRLLDIGCGSLRAGRLFIPYLLPGRYFGIEPNQWLIDQAIEHEVGRDLIHIKNPQFSNSSDFDLTSFGVMFDFIIAQSVFTHAPPRQIALCLSKARDVMTEESIFVSNWAEDDTSYDGDEWVYPGFVKYTVSRINQFMVDAGLVARRLNWTKPPSGQSWFVITRQDFPDIDKLTDPFAASRELVKTEEKLKFCEEQLDRLYWVLKRITRFDRSNGSHTIEGGGTTEQSPRAE